VRFGFVEPAWPFAARFAQRAVCARLIARRPMADIVRCVLGEAATIVRDTFLVLSPRSALIAASRRPSSDRTGWRGVYN
jgi:hypothetical protein